MRIAEIIEALRFVDGSCQLACQIRTADITSKILLVGQVRPLMPSAVLGEREPFAREMNVEGFIENLRTLGKRLHDKDFLIETTHELSEVFYELRCYKLTGTQVVSGGVLLVAASDELLELRQVHREPDFE